MPGGRDQEFESIIEGAARALHRERGCYGCHHAKGYVDADLRDARVVIRYLAARLKTPTVIDLLSDPDKE